MKKGYIKCPFCANEIKEGAIKCQFCESYLDGREKTIQKKTEKYTEKKGFWYRFFRKDLDLNKKRGHRFLKVIFWILLLTIVVVALIIPSFKTIINHEKVYKFVEPLDNRFTSELVNLPDLLNDGEIIFYDNTYGFPLFYIWQVGEGKYYTASNDQLEHFNDMYGGLDKDLSAYYCSTKLADNFSKLKKITGMTDVRAYEGAYDSVWWDIDNDIDKIKKYINENYIRQYTKVDKINCIAAKKYPDFKCLDFTWRNINDKYIFEEKPLLTLISITSDILALIVVNLILIGIISGILLIIYYKFIIYIIYGSYKKNN